MPHLTFGIGDVVWLEKGRNIERPFRQQKYIGQEMLSLGLAGAILILLEGSSVHRQAYALEWGHEDQAKMSLYLEFS